MAKYDKRAGQKVEAVMHEFKEGKLKSGRSGKKVKNREQAIAIGLSEARREGDRVPAPKKSHKKSKASTEKKSHRKPSVSPLKSRKGQSRKHQKDQNNVPRGRGRR